MAFYGIFFLLKKTARERKGEGKIGRREKRRVEKKGKGE